MATEGAHYSHDRNDFSIRLNKLGINIAQSQERIYNFLLDIVKRWPPEEVLLEFKRLFIIHVESVSSEALQAVYFLVISNNQDEFRHTLKRCCYILINNWDASRHYQPIQELIQLLADSATSQNYTTSGTMKRLRLWLQEFVTSRDFEELRLFAARYEEGKGPWSARYTSYLLVPQFINLENPVEQREAARALSQKLKDRFKFDLAMYIAKSQTEAPKEKVPKNPTILGDEALRLIKTIVAKRGPFSYGNLARIFLNQSRYLSFEAFKHSLKSYLIFSVDSAEVVKRLQTELNIRLDQLYPRYHEDEVNDALILRTSNRLIEYLTTENQQDPSPLFTWLLSNGNPLTLVVILLKIILICPNARMHLEARIAELIQYYEAYPEDQCGWIVNFLEVFNVTFAIHAENVQYNLVRMEGDRLSPQTFEPDRYRVFSQLRRVEPNPAELTDAEAIVGSLSLSAMDPGAA